MPRPRAHDGRRWPWPGVAGCARAPSTLPLRRRHSRSALFAKVAKRMAFSSFEAVAFLAGAPGASVEAGIQACNDQVSGTQRGHTASIQATKNPPERAFLKRMKGLEPSTFCMAIGSWVLALALIEEDEGQCVGG
jgi:hypothetical protein